MFKRRLSMFMLVALSMVVVFTGCSSNTGSNNEPTKNTESTTTPEASKDTEKPQEVVKLTIVNFGDLTPRRTEFLEKELHEKVLKELNIDLSFKFLPWGSDQQVDLMFASGENFATYGGTGGLGEKVNKGFLAEISQESLDKYAPNFKAIARPDAWEAKKLDGKIYSLPFGNKPYAGDFQMITVRQDLLEEVGINELKTMEDVEQAFKLVKEKHPDYSMIPEAAHVKKMFRAGLMPDQLFTPMEGNSPAWTYTYVDSSADDDKVYSFYESELFEKTSKVMADWKKKGYIDDSMITNPQLGMADWNAGKSLLNRGTSAYPMEQLPNLLSKISTGKLTNYQIGEQPFMSTVRDNVAYSISIGGVKDVDRYLQLFDWMFGSQETYDMLSYGILDKDYELTENGKVKKLVSDSFFDEWQIFNLEYGRFFADVPDEFIEQYKKNDEGSIQAKNIGFSFDARPVQAEVAKIQAVYTEKIVPIEYGLYDYDKYFPAALKALKDAGLDKYVAEMQKQFSEWYNNKSK
ncbi:ABC transporter substrate-binding protein [Paenibacillus antarcticus]|uniref:DUF3502 domain-containing protein n=1 Tax=Paenibacillus antarcticus TaxID=253703 RepID=A0A168KY88_9BACL|nr:ABC transporter substrate-binding protein [Paenibacillus antarcticus]OAB42620.1 hypothetical protein PBAT_20225 [Paenibacillus antarcticus]